MKRRLGQRVAKVTAGLFLLVGFTGWPLLAQDEPALLSRQDEERLVKVLRSEASAADKHAACSELKRARSQEAIEALGQLLADPELTHAARYALEALPDPAGEVLVKGLDTAGLHEKVGIILSLAVRRESRAVPTLAAMLRSEDDRISSAAARALGQIGGAEAAAALNAYYPQAKGRVHEAVGDGLLSTADGLVITGDPKLARPLFEMLAQDGRAPEGLRQAAFRGLVQAAGDQGPALLTNALIGAAGPEQTAALGMVRSAQFPEATTTFAGLLPRLDPAAQTALIHQLAQRGDSAAAPALAALVKEGDPVTREAALTALGVLGNASTVPLLAEVAATRRGVEQAAARLALARLPGPDTGQAMTTALLAGDPTVAAEMARALAERRETGAVPILLRAAQGVDDGPAIASFRALGLLANERELGELLNLATTSADRRSQAAVEALNSAVQRLLQSRRELNVRALVDRVRQSGAEGRVRVLTVFSGLVDPHARDLLRAEAASPEPAVRAAAISALCESVDAELLLDITDLATRSSDAAQRRAAVLGAARLWTQEEPAQASLAEKLRSAEKLFSLQLSDEESRMLLASAGSIADARVLRYAERGLTSDSLRNESARAVIGIASGLTDLEASEAALQRVLATRTDEPTRKAAQEALQRLRARAAHIVLWQASGPYRQPEKNYAALFDIPFPPEDSARPSEVEWTPMPPPSTPGHPYAMDLLKMYGGEQCVAYARTRIHSTGKQPVVLEMASDDGIKVWLNGEVVHANNTARPWEAAIDKASGELEPGWNTLLLKITQNNLGWEFSVRALTPEGTMIPGFKTSIEDW